MNKKGKRLGKGLSALLGEEPVSVQGVMEVALADIYPNPHQPRRHFDKDKLAELTDSIQAYGIIQPLVVVKQPDGYMLVAGERRLRAAKEAGFKSVPVIIRDYDDPSRAAIALIENIQREDLDPVEEAAAYYRLSEEFSLTQAEMAKKVGRSRSYIANSLRLLQLPEWIREQLRLRTLTPGQVRPLIGMHDPERQMELAQKILEKGWNARQVEQLVETNKTSSGKDIKKKKKEKKEQDAVSAYMAELADKLKLELGTPVHIHYGRNGVNVRGTIQIDFTDMEELERLVTYFES